MLLISLHHCASWSVPLWDAYDMSGFSHDVVHLIVQSFHHVYNTPHYNMDLDIRYAHVLASKFYTMEFYKGRIGKCSIYGKSP